MSELASIFRLACLALCAVCLASSASAATRNVPAQYATIQAAVTAANAGDTVSVADGTYTGAGNRNIDFGGKDLTVQSAFGNPANCVIDCQKLGRAFYFHSNETLKSNVAGFTIKNGVVNENPYGGGIYVTSSNPIINNCVFTGNSATDAGGGMYGGTATNCVFNDNSATYDGGGMEYGTATNCVFNDNSVPSNGYGGGMVGGTATNCAFTNNSAGRGGGMEDGTATHCTFTGNAASSNGGGIAYGTATNCTFFGNSSQSGGGMSGGTAISCVFTNNSAISNDIFNSEGGGMAFSTATNCVLSGNISYYGGGMYYGAAIGCVFTGNLSHITAGGMYYGTATNCVFTGNTANYGGGGDFGSSLYFCDVIGNYGGGVSVSPNASVTNCIIWGNGGGNLYGEASATVTYSDIQGGFAGTGNINADPKFVNQTTGNLHLNANSPCINKGTLAKVKDNAGNPIPLPATDSDGGNRIAGSGPDIGAYEYGNVGVFGTLNFDGISAIAPAQNVAFQFRPAGGGAAINQTYLTTSDGGFYLYGVPDGNYNLWMKSLTYLSALVPVTITGGQASITATLEPGDANNDNSVDSTDFGILIGAFNTSVSLPGSGYDATADFNGDGFVDSTDFGLLIGSFNRLGTP